VTYIPLIPAMAPQELGVGWRKAVALECRPVNSASTGAEGSREFGDGVRDSRHIAV